MQQWQCLCKYRPLIHFVVLIPHWKYDKGVSKYYPPCPSYEEENRLNKKQIAVCLFV